MEENLQLIYIEFNADELEHFWNEEMSNMMFFTSIGFIRLK